jgi:hypothetical protein
MEDVAQRLRNPTLVDYTRVIEGGDSNIESTESYQVFFPDSSVDVYTGGQDKVDEFRELVQKATEAGYRIEMQADVMRTAVSDYKENNLVNACLLQYPFGHGGLHENRIVDGDFHKEIDLLSYVSHLSRISQSHFHHELFVLILYNMKMKLNMVRSASWRVRNNATAEMLATELCEEDIEIAITRRRSGHTMNGRGDQYLTGLDAIA